MARSSLRDPLLDMISSGSPDVLSYLHLVRSRRIVVFQPTLDQCLLVACNKGSRIHVTYLLQAGAYLETRDCHGNTPLLVAATIGHVDIAALLIEHGADVNASNTRGRTALMVASEHGFPIIVSMLLQKMADVNHVDHAGNTSLILSMRRGCPIEVAETLLKQEGVNIEHINEKGETALTKALKEFELEKVKILLKGGPSLSDVQNIKESNNYNRCECAQDIADKAGIGQVVRLIQKHKNDDSMLLEAVLNRDLKNMKENLV
ncbi:ankyrin repeat and KH domain-containing protein 1-like [Physella acuta]|uniref:ankyrin repeat and KH domain-containing protein 1-like n=1 Tax=Physella acuta TaxID=109671 RepID=UPI0027DD0B88|nr:ankyrin repeat and KH domain-containing protein 1-like [Physella acuta]